MEKKLLLVFAWVVYLPALFFATLSLVAGSAYWMGTDFPAGAILAGLRLTLYAALILTIPIGIRWWLKNLTWGTFAVYSFLLSAGFVMQAAYQELLDEMMVSNIMYALGAVVVPLSWYFFYKNIMHTKAVVAESKKGRRR